jgi:hypothetical protein
MIEHLLPLFDDALVAIYETLVQPTHIDTNMLMLASIDFRKWKWLNG